MFQICDAFNLHFLDLALTFPVVVADVTEIVMMMRTPIDVVDDEMTTMTTGDAEVIELVLSVRASCLMCFNLI